MAFVKRDATGQIVAISREQSEEFSELVTEQDAELQAFLVTVGSQTELAQTDLDFIRVLDDLLALLLEKNILLYTELPLEAQRKLAERNRLRRIGQGALDLVDDENLF